MTTLRQYLDKHQLTTTAFAAKVDVSHATIVRLLNGTRRPSLDLAQRIHRETHGDVPAHDWPEIEAQSPQPQPPKRKRAA